MPVLRTSNFEDATVQGWAVSGGTGESSLDRASGGTRSLKGTKTGAAGSMILAQPSTPITAGALTLTFAVGQAAPTAKSVLIFADLMPGALFLEPDGGGFNAAITIPTTGLATRSYTFTIPVGYTELLLYARHDSSAVGDALYLDEVVVSQDAVLTGPWVRIAGVYVQTPGPLVRVAGVYV